MWIHKVINLRVFQFTILEIMLFFAIFTMPFGFNLNSLAVIFFCIAGAFQNSWLDKKAQLRTNLLWILPVCLFFIFLASIIWDPNGVDALKALEKRTSFLFLPVVIASLQRLNKDVLKTAFFVFVVSVFIVCLCCIVRSTSNYLITKDYRIFFYQYLSQQMHLNAIYLSLYCAFCLYIIIFYSFIKPGSLKFLKPIFAIILCLFFGSFILLLSSKTIILISLFTIIGSVLFLSYRKHQLLKGVLFILLIVGAGGLIIWNAPYIKWRIQVTLPKKYEGSDDNQNGLAVRQKLWETSSNLIKKKPIIGYGVKYANERLVEEFNKNDFQIAVENRYNSHNTYLQVLLNLGILGFIPLLILLLGALALAWKRKDYLFLMFISTIVLLGITEAIFEGQRGIVFVIFFLFLFIYHSTSESTLDEH